MIKNSFEFKFDPVIETTGSAKSPSNSLSIFIIMARKFIVKMEFARSSPPISYMVNNEQFIFVVSTWGGRLLRTGDKIYGYKLQND